MLHPETLAAYRRMTPSEKMSVTMQMMRENAQRFFSAPSDVIEKRLEILRMQNDDRNQRMLEAIARTRVHHG
jgi:hypothetical protein